jgi:MinD-like ATPase involved in chromosome partitioning or flagellar assembly
MEYPSLRDALKMPATVKTQRPLILPIASGKGGVGKTTVAVNLALALARHDRTILVDLDTGTSSVRNTIPGEVEHDLYHFLRKGRPLDQCLTKIPAAFDPAGDFANFSYAAAPIHFIEELVNLHQASREALMRGINALPARFIITDLRAGADDSVLDFLPLANSGLLVFTPNLPAATLAAADLVKAGLFRKLRALFGAESQLWRRLSGQSLKPLIDDLILRVEDPYDESIPNLDAFLADLHHALGEHPVVEALRRTLDHYRVFFVLNRFDAVNEAYDTAIKPFVESLTKYVSGRLQITNLGWIMESPEVHESNRLRRPLMLGGAEPAHHAHKRRAHGDQELESLQAIYGGFKQQRPIPPAASHKIPDPGPQLAAQLDTLKVLYQSDKKLNPRQNFAYLASRVLYFADTSPVGELGDEKLFTPAEAIQALTRF